MMKTDAEIRERIQQLITMRADIADFNSAFEDGVKSTFNRPPDSGDLLLDRALKQLTLGPLNSTLKLIDCSIYQLQWVLGESQETEPKPASTKPASTRVPLFKGDIQDE